MNEDAKKNISKKQEAAIITNTRWENIHTKHSWYYSTKNEPECLSCQGRMTS